MVCTGGTITSPTINGITYNVHRFTTTGATNFVITKPYGVSNTYGTIEYFLVGGGGPGGWMSAEPADSKGASGGGSGGQVISGSFFASASKTEPVFVGTQEQSSSFFSINAQAGRIGGYVNSNGYSGYNGSGAGTDSPSTKLGGTGSNGGFNGGASEIYIGTNAVMAGGGGAGSGGPGGNTYATGSNNNDIYAGSGGAGIYSNFDGVVRCYGAGGGGGNIYYVGGLGFVGHGSTADTNSGGVGALRIHNPPNNSTPQLAGSGVPNTGGGGGGGAGLAVIGSGGSGIVIIRYPIIIRD